MRGWWQDLTDLVLPAECGGCGRSRTVLCPECRAALSGAAPSRVRPVPEPPGLPVVHAAARYADEVRAVLLAHKERGALALATPLGTALAEAVRAGLREARGRGAGDGGVVARRGDRGGGVTARHGESNGGVVGRRGDSGAWGAGAVPGGGMEPPVWGTEGGCEGRRDAPVGRRGAGVAGAPEALGGPAGGCDGPVLLVPVPSARWAVRARGHDPARRIALAAAGELRRGGTPARVVAVLRQRRAVADQAGLNSRQRLENLAGALTVLPGGARLLREGRVVVVDDLMTTGASLSEAARAVRAACAEDLVGFRRVAGRVSCGEAATAVYAAATREGREERIAGPVEEEADRVYAGPGLVGEDAGGDLICAAVVAAPPYSFEINRN